MAALFVFAKINANEAYAVERVTRRARSEGDELAARLDRFVLLDETYHTRILLSATTLFGARVSEPARPVVATRAIVAGIAGLPEIASRPITLAGEIIGILTFLRLLGAVRRVFASRPEIRESLEERVIEVLVDEVGHMSLNRLLARAGTFAALRALLPAFAIGTAGTLPEAVMLGVLPVPMRDAMSFDVTRDVPDEVRRRAFVA
jgi:hypothetical protein